MGYLMYHIIVNPNAKSGKAAKQWKQLKAALDTDKVTYILHLTKSGKDATAYTRSITDRSICEKNPSIIHRIIVLGGDGTLNCVINGIDDITHTQITYLPAGTSNDFAKAMHFSANPFQAITALSMNGNSRPCDIGVAKLGNREKRFHVSCGIGYDAAICAEADLTPAKKLLNRLGLGKLIYVTVALKQLKNLTPVTCDLILDDKQTIHIQNFYFATAMQQPYEGGGFMFCPKANAQDGLLDLCVFGDIKKLYALSLFPLATKGSHIGKKGVRYFRCRHARIVLSEPAFVHTDGEVHGKYKEISVGTHEIPLTFRTES